MFTRRVATFLLGVWIGCCLLVDLFALPGNQAADRIVASQSAEIHELVSKAGAPNVTPLLHHLSGERMRALRYNWEPAQIALGMFVIILLVFTDQRKLLAIGLSAVMVILTIIQHFFITPDWIVLGQQADFLPEAASFSVRSQLMTLTQAYGALEIVKLLVGGGLASYFFVMESVRRTRRKESRREEGTLNATVR
jgi:hypothetical protein